VASSRHHSLSLSTHSCRDFCGKLALWSQSGMSPLWTFAVLLAATAVVDSQLYHSTIYRFRCPTVFPTRHQLVNSNAVVLTGTVEEVRPVENDEFGQYLATVLVRRVMFGPRNLRRTRISVTGFN